MKLIKKGLLITIFIISNIQLFSNPDYSHILKIADSYYENQQYRSAVKEYQRYIFLTGNENVPVLMKIASGLLNQGNSSLSFQYYEKAFFLTDDPDLKFECKLPEIQYYIQNYDYNNALLSLYSLSNEYYLKHAPKINFLFAVTFFGMENYAMAESYFIKTALDDSNSIEKIASIFDDSKRFNKPNPKFISTLSIFIPGSGQLLCGEIKDGLNSLILTESLALFAVFTAYNYSIIDAIVSIIPWYQRYLMGGLDNAELAALHKRDLRRNKAYLDILDLLPPLN